MNMMTKQEVNQPNRTAKRQNLSSGLIRRRARRGLIVLAAFALLLPCLLLTPEVSANDFHLYFQDDATGNRLFMDAVTGDYLMIDKEKRSFLAGRGKVTVTSCAIELQDSGANPKHPDRSVYILYNPCERVAKALCEVFSTTETYSLNDRDTTDNDGAFSTADSETAKSPHIRFEPTCLQDDANSSVSISFVNGTYAFRDHSKGVSLQGTGSIVTTGCKVKISHDGADPKRPDRHVYIEYNSCTRVGTVFVWIASTGQTYFINDSDSRNSSCPRTN
jgi:hypothetical protein